MGLALTLMGCRQRNALLSLLLIVGYLFVGVGAYNFYFENWGMIKAIYFGIVTLTRYEGRIEWAIWLRAEDGGFMWDLER